MSSNCIFLLLISSVNYVSIEACISVCVLGLNSITLYVLLVGKREKESREKGRTRTKKKRRSKRNRPGRKKGKHVRIDLMQSWIGSNTLREEKRKNRKNPLHTHTHICISNSYHFCSISFPFRLSRNRHVHVNSCYYRPSIRTSKLEEHIDVLLKDENAGLE